LVLLAVLLLPVDIALRRLVITRRDWERAYAATFGRIMPQKVQPTQARAEQMSQLFQAKKRAGLQKQEAEAESTPAPIQREDASKQMQPKTEPRPSPPAASSAPKPSTPASGSLASRLLDKKRQQGEQPDEK
jgi:hypothetical protein